MKTIVGVAVVGAILVVGYILFSDLICAYFGFPQTKFVRLNPSDFSFLRTEEVDLGGPGKRRVNLSVFVDKSGREIFSDDSPLTGERLYEHEKRQVVGAPNRIIERYSEISFSRVIIGRLIALIVFSLLALALAGWLSSKVEQKF